MFCLRPLLEHFFQICFENKRISEWANQRIGRARRYALHARCILILGGEQPLMVTALKMRWHV
jgi:hypothetical protein